MSRKLRSLNVIELDYYLTIPNNLSEAQQAEIAKIASNREIFETCLDVEAFGCSGEIEIPLIPSYSYNIYEYSNTTSMLHMMVELECSITLVLDKGHHIEDLTNPFYLHAYDADYPTAKFSRSKFIGLVRDEASKLPTLKDIEIDKEVTWNYDPGILLGPKVMNMFLMSDKSQRDL